MKKEVAETALPHTPTTLQRVRDFFVCQNMLLLLIGMIVYAAVRFVGLEQFPIYFFCDEAIQPVIAENLLNNDFRDKTGTFLPPYFQNVEKWSLSLTVYLQLIGVALFGKSVMITRATSVIVGMLAPVAIALTLKLVFNNRAWWLAPLVMSGLPAWFLHSRTAFETPMMVAFFACFLCSYLLYRTYSPYYLFAALVFGAATFYTYTNGQGVMLISGVLLLLADIRYHIDQFRQRPGLLAGAILVTALLAMPMIRFYQLHPKDNENHLQNVLQSYWYKPIPLNEKLMTFGKTYLEGLDPRYWFLYSTVDPERHRIKDIGHVPIAFAPFVALGLGVCLWRWRSSSHRAVLFAILAAPFASSLAYIIITRVLAMMVPVTLLACIGLDQLLTWTRRWIPARPVLIVYALVLTGWDVHLAHRSLTKGPTWYTTYIMEMQYGAKQVFEEAIPEVIGISPPDTQILVSHTWANNPQSFIDFFLSDDLRRRVRLFGLEHDFLFQKGNLTPNLLFVITPIEYEKAVKSGKFDIANPERVVFYPNGQAGFYFVRMRYVDHVDELFAADREARSALLDTTVQLEGEPIHLRHSMIDMGNPQYIFDGKTDTLMRGLEANPFVMEFIFPSPRSIDTVAVNIRTTNAQMKVIATPADGSQPVVGMQDYRTMPVDSRIDYSLPEGPIEVSKLRLEIRNLNEGIVSHIHVWEVQFLGEGE